MREILFRGLHRRKGEKVRMDGTPVESMWVYGGYCQYNEERGIIYQAEPNICKYSVYADSVGQYTGLNDKNGVRIFEGDILESDGGNKGYIVFVNGAFMKSCVSEKFPFSIRADVNKVIGNIYDNPELIGGE